MKVSIAAFGCAHGMIPRLYGFKPDILINTGDICYGDTRFYAEMAGWMSSTCDCNILITGNHDLYLPKYIHLFKNTILLDNTKAIVSQTIITRFKPKAIIFPFIFLFFLEQHTYSNSQNR